MMALDTNVVVRFLVRDERRQSQLVYARFRKAESSREVLFVPLVVVLETIWVLESAYGKSRQEILNALEDLRGMPILEFEKDRVLQSLMQDGRENAVDLSDLLMALAARSSGCSGVLTFDKKASRRPFFELLT